MSFAYLGLLVVERSYELWLSRRNAASTFARGGVEVGQGLYRVMAVFHALFFVACVLEARPFHVGLYFSFLPVALCAMALRYWAIRTLGELWNTRVIVVPGEAPVTTGPYRFMKHPNYLAVCLELFSVPMMIGAWRTALVFSLGNALILWWRIRDEERALGPVWEQAFAGRRRLVPGGRHG